MFTSPGEIAFSIGPVSLHYYGIIMAFSLLIGVLTAKIISANFYKDINPEIIYDISPHIIIGAILGARIYYCVLSYSYYMQNPAEIIQLWHGGLSIHGAIIGGLISGIIYAKRHKLPVLKLCDIFSYGLILGQAIGRWGNFFNSEAFGRPTENFLKLYIPIYDRPLEYMQYNYFHPTFLYESILDVDIGIDATLIVANPTDESAHLAKRIEEFSTKYAVGGQIGVVLNKVGNKEIVSVYELLKKYDLEILGVIPVDENLLHHSIERESLIVQDAIKQFYFRLNLPQG